MRGKNGRGNKVIVFILALFALIPFPVNKPYAATLEEACAEIFPELEVDTLKQCCEFAGGCNINICVNRYFTCTLCAHDPSCNIDISEDPPQVDGCDCLKGAAKAADHFITHIDFDKFCSS